MLAFYTLYFAMKFVTIIIFIYFLLFHESTYFKVFTLLWCELWLLKALYISLLMKIISRCLFLHFFYYLLLSVNICEYCVVFQISSKSHNKCRIRLLGRWEGEVLRFPKFRKAAYRIVFTLYSESFSTLAELESF